MAKFFFHTSDGDNRRDREGVELPDARAARVEAVSLLAEILRDDAEKFIDGDALRVVVMDAADRPVFEIVASGPIGGPRPGK